MDKADLLKLIEDDDLGLLKIEAERSAAVTENDRLSASFNEINQFVTEQGREPRASNDIHEHQLYARLAGIRENKRKMHTLLDLDEHGLLGKEIKEIKTLQDIYEDDDLHILDSDAEDIFTLKHISNTRNPTDYKAIRKQCQNFYKFEDKFIQCQADLASGKRKILPFKYDVSIDEGQFFVLNGVLLYVEKVGEREVNGEQVNPRLLCIFENGTESDMLLRSLATMLSSKGRRISECQDGVSSAATNITNNDAATGYIYVLKSLSKNPEIQCINDLYKIGFSTIAVEKRIENSASQPTYLMADVSIIVVYKCYNMNTHKFEQLLHTFFGSSCLNIDVFDSEQHRHVPREWFIVPLAVIEQAIQHLITGEIVHYKYDPDRKIIVRR